MTRFAMAQMNQSKHTDATCAPAASCVCAQSAASCMILDTAILAVSIFICLLHLVSLVSIIILLVLVVRIMNQLNMAESRNAAGCSGAAVQAA